jgi:hypothetical protein
VHFWYEEYHLATLGDAAKSCIRTSVARLGEITITFKLEGFILIVLMSVVTKYYWKKQK